LAAGAVLIIELTNGSRARFLEALESGLLQQESTSQRAPEVITGQLKRLRKVVFEQ
jgi:hypothetical protein